MQILIVGSGKLATELIQHLSLDVPVEVVAWSSATRRKSRAIVVHAGSGRELQEVFAFCQETKSILIELATGSGLESVTSNFPIVMCPNINILMLKFMSMIAKSGCLFHGYDILLQESHQAGKASTPGTAVAMALSLGLSKHDIVSVRDPEEQSSTLRIPAEHLGRHALHRISIRDAACSITLETRVYGASPYAEGLAKIISAVSARPLESRIYAINEMIENAWV